MTQRALSPPLTGPSRAPLRPPPLPLPPPPQAGQSDPDIFFTDRPRNCSAGLGQRNKEYVSFWADEEPVLMGRTPMQVRRDPAPRARGTCVRSRGAHSRDGPAATAPAALGQHYP